MSTRHYQTYGQLDTRQRPGFDPYVLVAGLLVAWLLAPAEPAPPPNVSFGPGVVDVRTADDRFRLKVGVFGQLQLTARHDEENGDTRSVFEVRRARLKLSGHTFGPSTKYYVQLAFSPRDLQITDGRVTRTPIFDWIVSFDQLRDLSVDLGQYRVPFSRQRRVAIGDLAMVDRALANFEFNLDRDVGFDVHSDDIAGLDRMRYAAGVFTGQGRDAHEFTDPRFLYVARFEVLPLGIFEDYDETDHERSARPRLALGAAYAFIDHAARDRGVLGSPPPDGGTTDVHTVTGDVVLKVAGVTVLAEAYWRRGRRRFGALTVVDPVTGAEMPAPRDPARNGLGWFVQAGWLLPRGIPIELVTRYSQVLPGRVPTSLTRRDEVGGGIQWFIRGSALELVLDAFHQFDDGRVGTGADTVRLLLELGL